MEMWQYLGVRLISCSALFPMKKEPNFLGLVVETVHWQHTCPTLLTNKKPLTKLEICRHNTRGPDRQESRIFSTAQLSCAC